MCYWIYVVSALILQICTAIELCMESQKPQEEKQCPMTVPLLTI